MDSEFESAVAQIQQTRGYSRRLIDSFPEGDWFRQPAGGVTHLAWQVGHLAFAQFALALLRVRGPSAADDEIITPQQRALFGRGSVVSADAADYPARPQLLELLDHVQERVLAELSQIDTAAVAEPLETSHPMFTDRTGALVWCAQHEMLHAGQIGLLRRLLGQQPLR